MMLATGLEHSRYNVPSHVFSMVSCLDRLYNRIGILLFMPYNNDGPTVAQRNNSPKGSQKEYFFFL